VSGVHEEHVTLTGLSVSNSPRGYHYFSEVGTSLKSVGFGEVVPFPVRKAFFSRILLTTRLCRPKMIGPGRGESIRSDLSGPPARGKM